MKQLFAGAAAALLAVALLIPMKAEAVSARRAYVLDAVSGRVLFSRSADERSLIVVNKADLPRAFDPPEGAISLSAATGEGVETLREALSARISGSAPEDDCLTVQRHIDRARGAQAALARAVQAIDTGVPLDVAAVELWEARRELGEITGDDASEAVVSEIFASFCVGK